MASTAAEHSDQSLKRPQPWAPRWALVAAWVALVLVGAAGIFLLWVIAEDLAYDGDKFHGLAAGLAGVGIGALAVSALPWAWFVRRGGKVAFAAGLALLAVVPVILFSFFGL